MSNTIHFDKWVGTNRKLNKRERLKYWVQRLSIYQWYVWKRHGKKIVISDTIRLTRRSK